MYYDDYDKTPSGVATPYYTSAAAAALSAGGNDRTRTVQRAPIIRGSTSSDASSIDRSLDRKLVSSGAVKLMLPGKYSVSRGTENESTVFDALPGSKAGVGASELPAADSTSAAGGKPRPLPKALLPKDARRVSQQPPLIPGRIAALTSSQQPRRSSIAGYAPHSTRLGSSSVPPESPMVASSTGAGNFERSSIDTSTDRTYRSASIFGDTVVSTSWSKPEVEFNRRRNYSLSAGESAGRRFVVSEPNAGMLMLRQQKADREAVSTGSADNDDDSEVFTPRTQPPLPPSAVILRRAPVATETVPTVRTGTSSGRRLSFADSMSYFASSDEGGQRQKVMPPRPDFLPKPTKYLHFNTLDGATLDATDASLVGKRQEVVPAFIRRTSQSVLPARSTEAKKSEFSGRQNRDYSEKPTGGFKGLCHEVKVTEERSLESAVRLELPENGAKPSTLVVCDNTTMNTPSVSPSSSVSIPETYPRTSDATVQKEHSSSTRNDPVVRSNSHTSDVIAIDKLTTRGSIELPSSTSTDETTEARASIGVDDRRTDREGNALFEVNSTSDLRLDNCNGASTEHRTENHVQSSIPLLPPPTTTFQMSPPDVVSSDQSLSSLSPTESFSTSSINSERSPSLPVTQVMTSSPTDDEESAPPPLPVSLPPPLTSGTINTSLTFDASAGEGDRYADNDDDDISNGAAWTGNNNIPGGNNSSSSIVGWYWRTATATPVGGFSTHHRPTDSTATVDSGRGSVSGYSGQMSDGHEDNALSSADELDLVDCTRRRSPSGNGSVRSDRFYGSPRSMTADGVRQDGPDDSLHFGSPLPGHRSVDVMLSPTTSDVMTTDSELDDCREEHRYIEHEYKPNSPKVTSISDDVATISAVSFAGPDIFVPPPPFDILNQLLAESGTTLTDLEHRMSAATTSSAERLHSMDIPMPQVLCTTRDVEKKHGEDVTKSKIADHIKISALNDLQELGGASDQCNQNRSTKVTADSKRLMDITVVKGSLGLGFCIQGGVGSPAGDRPISIKRLFRSGDGLGDLKPGDEILAVDGVKLVGLSHYDAWNRLKSISDGTFVLTVARS